MLYYIFITKGKCHTVKKVPYFFPEKGIKNARLESNTGFGNIPPLPFSGSDYLHMEEEKEGDGSWRESPFLYRRNLWEDGLWKRVLSEYNCGIFFAGKVCIQSRFNLQRILILRYRTSDSRTVLSMSVPPALKVVFILRPHIHFPGKKGKKGRFFFILLFFSLSLSFCVT